MKISRKFLIYIILFSLSIKLYSQNCEAIFSRKEVLNDIDSLKNVLEQSHYNLYAYTSRKKFDKNFKKVKGSIIQDSISLKIAVGLFQQIISKANTGHAEIDFPSASYINFVKSGGRLFPLEIALENDKAYIRKNFSNNLNIKIGSELKEINGKRIDQILAMIYPHISAERTYLKNAKIEFWSLPRLYWQIYGEVEEFAIATMENSQFKKHILKPIPALEGYEYKKEDILNTNRRIEFYNNTVYLNPGNFSGDENDYKNFIDSAYSEINKYASQNLIIDLRNNAGGNNSLSDYLISFIADKPFKWNSSFNLKSSETLKRNTRKYNDTLDPYFQEILKHKNGEAFEYDFKQMQPQELNKRYNGKVYILINRQSYSQAAISAGLIQDYKFATLVGEETGDFPSLYASVFTTELPNTGIAVKIPKGYIIRVNKSEKPMGVIPDIEIEDHLLDDEDEILIELLKKIK